MEESRYDQCYEGCHGKEDDNQRGSEKVQRSLQVPFVFRPFPCNVYFFHGLSPPTNEVCEGYVFTSVCHSVHGGGGVCIGGGRCSDPVGYCGIRSMSRRYASYWNAFLLYFLTVERKASWPIGSI